MSTRFRLILAALLVGCFTLAPGAGSGTAGSAFVPPDAGGETPAGEPAGPGDPAGEGATGTPDGGPVARGK